ncbi:MAG: Heat shock protein HslU [Leptospirillum sp. Group II 'C75']|uniref:ATP-dependent protease ATPase subunit HslU n=1 Tax=Leptospirillum sp. Group II 'CF-1' TaxID=1660083 RepID=UPI00029CBA46|nr:ATP-dependent protease ATPase subunit HslU [Leptospirillum sp. Group II 'CF-1']AKS22699.1 ATP-dependent protease ATP-binding subunit HslU [Leptospirillum sp. Group II 'CF-1']EIJ75413.1 MAG: Heat shock protein HslU [Leptospirillum sp. Group II 'C75']
MNPESRPEVHSPAFPWTPGDIVRYLDRYIIGQGDAKKAVAVAIRNRVRRERVSGPMKEEILPRNILMIGATGSGKTEIARRLSRLLNAPFLKVEATKYTEVGYVGRNVESMIRDLAEVAYNEGLSRERDLVREDALKDVRERLLDALLPGGGQEATRSRLASRLDAGDLEDREVEILLRETSGGPPTGGSDWDEGSPEGMREMLGSILPPRQIRRRLAIRDARPLLLAEAADARVDAGKVSRETVARVEESGILFIDEIDKVIPRSGSVGADVSREGVQRDLLPIVEGSSVRTRHGIVRTDRILFIAAGAFHHARPSDLIPEFQGRFPVRVTLTALGSPELYRILTETEGSLVSQYKALLETEGVILDFREDGLREIAEVAWQVNEGTQNIGARRLFTVMEHLLEDVSFRAPEMAGQTVVIDRPFVQERLGKLVLDPDLTRYIL